MCLLAFNWNNHPEYRLIMVANRDEFFERPSQPIHHWPSGIFAGKDLRAGGTWLGMHSNGRFAALTNVRDMRNIKSNPKSRGNLVRDFLEGNMDCLSYLSQIEGEKDAFEGFNLLVSDGQQLYYLSNYHEGVRELTPGIYGLSNALLETPWPKLTLAKSNLSRKIEEGDFQKENLMGILHSKEIAPDHELPDTGLGLQRERLMSCQFISAKGIYGTINTTVLLWKHNGEVEMRERTFDQPAGTHFDTEIKFEVNSFLAQKS